MRKFFPSTLTPYDGQLKALEEIAASFNDGKRFFILEGPTGFGKYTVGKAVLNLCGKGFITSPLNSLVRQYAQTQFKARASCKVSQRITVPPSPLEL